MRKPRKHGLYLLHFEPRYKHAAHYLGFSDDIQSRVASHRAGTARVRLTDAAASAGCMMFLVRTWPGTRTFERSLKGFRGARSKASRARLCPACYALQLLARKAKQQ